MTAQPSLFTTDDPPASAATGPLVQVVFNQPLHQLFTYRLPDELRANFRVGQRLLVPFGPRNKPLTAFAVATTEEKQTHRIKTILRILDPEPLLTPALLELTRWMATYYLCTWGQVLEAVLPKGAKTQAGTRARRFVELRSESEWPQPPPKLSAKQKHVVELLQQARAPVEVQELAALARCGMAVVAAIVHKGLAQRSLQRVEQWRPDVITATRSQPLVLNPDQQAARVAIEQAILQNDFRPFLLHGVTGSGKTEVYLQAIQQVVAQGKEALVLVPEIRLTPQTIERFRGRFSRVAVLHSHLTEAERGQYWRQILSGDVQVVVGARSAVFAPTRRLGLIVVDEEHEGSFKQETTPRYHGRDVAVLRAKQERIPIVLGSATPSLESWQNAQRNQYQLLKLPKRVEDRPLPAVRLIDLRHDAPSRGQYRALSGSLERAMREALGHKGQVMLLLNRRGFATFLVCPACAAVVKCKFCDVTMTQHKQRNVAQCHYCGYECEPPERCPECGLAQIRYLGQGTEKLEAEVRHKFPGHVVERMDSDTMQRRGMHAAVLDGFRKGEIDILLGTQMIAKGLDFPNVTLVGVINADLALHLPDFRSAERTFQLLAQVAGRTGRGDQGGIVLIQTLNPEQPCIHLAARHDFEQFAALELKQRKAHFYPPFCRIVRFLLRSRDQESVHGFADHVAGLFRQAIPNLKDQAPDIRVLGPAEAPLFRLQGFYRYHFQMQSRSATTLHELLNLVVPQLRPPKGVEWSVDVDPLSLL